MATRFPGFPQAGLDFLAGLAVNNDREWFTPRKAIYEEQVKAPMVALVDALNQELAAIAPEFMTEPSKAIYRIYRDTRFSKDKTPYKTHVGANFHNQNLDKHASSGFYCGISPAQIEVAAGVYMPGPEELLAVRNAISSNWEEFSQLVSDKKVLKLVGPLQGDELTRPPKGFAADDPAVEWLKKKSWHYYATDLDPAVAATPKLLPELVKRMKVMVPMVRFFERALAGKPSASDFF